MPCCWKPQFIPCPRVLKTTNSGIDYTSRCRNFLWFPSRHSKKVEGIQPWQNGAKNFSMSVVLDRFERTALALLHSYCISWQAFKKKNVPKLKKVWQKIVGCCWPTRLVLGTSCWIHTAIWTGLNFWYLDIKFCQFLSTVGQLITILYWNWRHKPLDWFRIEIKSMSRTVILHIHVCGDFVIETHNYSVVAKLIEIALRESSGKLVYVYLEFSSMFLTSGDVRKVPRFLRIQLFSKWLIDTAITAAHTSDIAALAVRSPAIKVAVFGVGWR